MSLNRWVFKWRLKVRMFSHSRMSAGREFQVDGAANSLSLPVLHQVPLWFFLDLKALYTSVIIKRLTLR